MSSPSPAAGPQRVRVSDAEREEVATVLRAAMSEGRLTLEEGEERLTAGYAARFRDELGPLTADLPDGGRRALLETPEARARLRRVRRWRFGGAAVLTVLVAALLALPGAHPWHVIPLIVLLVVLHKHAHLRRYGHRYGHRPYPRPDTSPQWSRW